LSDTETSERILIPGSWRLDFSHAAGRAASRFLVALRDEGTILASPCPRCGRVRVPPRSFCEDCFVRTSDDWVEVGPGGVVEAFTVTRAEFPGYPPPPHALAYVRLDGAGTAMANFVEGLDLSQFGDTPGPGPDGPPLAIGDRVRAVFSDDRQARITDFHFERE
jgi:uncharacterized OB-fold protein